MAIDYKSFGPNGPAAQARGERLEMRWWLKKGDELAQSVAPVVEALSQYDSRRQTQYQISTRLYGNISLMGLNGLSYSKIAASQNTLKDRISYNVVQSVVDTVSAKMAKNKPRPLFLTSGGDYKLQRRAKNLDKFVEGVFYENNAYDLGKDIFKDACVFGDGLVHVYEEDGRVRFERVIPSEIYIDQMESFYGYPRQMHRVKNVDRAVLMDLFPEHKGYIEMANSSSTDLTGVYNNVADLITVIESWHLPSGKDATDGLHSIVIAGRTLFSEKYTAPFFPFAKFSWSKRLYGYFGQGLAEQIQNIQLEINKILWVIQRSMHMNGTFKILMENSSKIVKEHFSNDIGAVLCYTGTPPTYLTPPAVPPEYYQHLQTLKASAYEQAGVSMLSATSTKPLGLNSGKALREFNDIESERFMVVGQAYEDFFIKLAKLVVWKSMEIAEETKHYKVKYVQKSVFKEIDWKDISLDEDDYVMKIYPTSSLPQDPSGRLQTIQEYAQAGYLSPRQARRLLDFPDLEQVEDLNNSSEELISKVLECIIDDGEYTAPEPTMDLVLAREMALEYYNQGKLSGVEPEKLELINTFMAHIDILMQKAMPPAPPMAPGQPGAPQASPMPMPQSDLIQNVPGIT